MYVRWDDKTSSWWLPSKWENWNPPSAAVQVMGCLPFSASTSPCTVLYYFVLNTVYYDVQCCAHAVSWLTIPTSPTTVLCCTVLPWSTVLYYPLLVQWCASWVTNFTSPYLAWHSIYLSRWKLIYPFLFKLLVLSDFRGLCDPSFW